VIYGFTKLTRSDLRKSNFQRRKSQTVLFLDEEIIKIITRLLSTHINDDKILHFKRCSINKKVSKKQNSFQYVLNFH
jgi:hypothetical protein